MQMWRKTETQNCSSAAMQYSSSLGSAYKYYINVITLVKVPPTPVNHLWRAPLLFKLLQERSDLEQSLQDTKVITTVINSLCSS